MAPFVPIAAMDVYRREQAVLGGRVAAGVSQLVRERLDPANPDRGWAALLEELIALIRGGRGLSEQLAMEFYRYLRELEGAVGAPPEPEVEFPTNSVMAGLIWTGPRLAKSLKRQEPTITDRQLLARVGVMVGRSAMRQTLNAGREVTRKAVVEDPAAWGWARLTDADPCNYCKRLADRGPVFKSARSAGALRKFHDGCACSVVAVFAGPSSRPGGRSRSRRGSDGLTDRERAVIERVRREVDGV